MSTFSHLWPSVSFAGCGASLLSSLALACRSELRQRWRPVREGFSCGEPRVSQAFASNRIHETIQAFDGVPRHIPLIESKGELVHVPTEMLGAHLMVNAVNPALQDSPNRFDAIRAHRPACILTSRMRYRVMPKEQTIQAIENDMVIRVELRSNFDIGVNLALDVADGPQFDDLGPGVSGA